MTGRFSSLVSAPSRATVAVAFVRGMLAGLGEAQRDARRVLEQAHISPGVLADPQARVPVERYAELYNLVCRELDDEGFALFSVPLRSGSFEFLCRSSITAPTLAVAIDRSARFLRLVLPDLAVHLDNQFDEACLRISEVRPLKSGRVFAFEWLLRLLHGLFSWLVGRSILLDSVAFPYPRPEHATDYSLIYTAQSTFDCDVLCARFSSSLLELPIRRDEAALQSFLEGAPGKLTTLYRRDRETVLRVRNALRDGLPSATSLTDVARVLHLSPRTLHRRLEHEGSSFQTIKDALRHDLAINRLVKTHHCVAEVAAELGFADTAAFYRAFVRWTGMSPAQYRRRWLPAPPSRVGGSS
ncbi:MAG: AraC family transcriptional regulator [Candidatus Accumulibacter sp.]|uniref:AraC family transcriptional regulator n=2 Tax=Accumulibacter sp. TaxID=2053492 RepID=UPI0026003B6D|nr:AraC family transcriptional regulator [Accumulibacter sp.]MCM8596983.1 AraC family transcriptional regulator [Accumulibacter sp.]MCM8625225.1 AraC family transcriptional regulator [Accumulibacter sp.]MDS4051132.1 AraC family transcriptional regulator [Accumulibacter sp.]